VWKTAHPRILKAVDGIGNGAGHARRADEWRRLIAYFGAAVARSAPAQAEAGEPDVIYA
jgi:hypothetical protein